MSGSAKTLIHPSLVAALAAFLAGMPPAAPAAAQSGPAAGQADPTAEAPPATRVQSYARDFSPSPTQGGKLESLLGREVKTRDEDPGRIIDILCDRSGRVQAAVIELGGFLGIGTRKIAVDWSALRFDEREKRQTVVLEMTREQLRSAPEFKPSDPVFVRRTD